MKGRSSYIIQTEFKEEISKELWVDHILNTSYFICTVSENSKSNVLNYIRNQKLSKQGR